MSVRCIINNSLNCYYWAVDYTSILLFYQKFFFFFFLLCGASDHVIFIIIKFSEIPPQLTLCWFELLLRNFTKNELDLRWLQTKSKRSGFIFRHADTSQVVLHTHEFWYVLPILLSLLFFQFILRKEQNHRKVRYWTKGLILYTVTTFMDI